jgi:hypothetical protein
MKPDSIYCFEQCPEARTRYRLTSHYGADIPNFPARWVKDCKGGKAGERYIGFRDKKDQKAGHRQFTHALELEKARMVTGLNFDAATPRRAFGDYGADALLIAFSDDWQRLTILFFNGQKEAAQSIFQSWIAGDIPEIAAAAAPRLETKKAG